ncbi:MAG: hypothetical protein JWP74_1077 [Marmoricola sp.]|nr:hypothetical protein [Marmoricola sp.]
MALPESHPDRRPGSELTLAALYDLVPFAEDLDLVGMLVDVLGAQVVERFPRT